jgi:glutaredoxin
MYKLYSKDNCSWCVKAKDLMNSLNLQYTELKLDVDYTREELRELLGEHLPLTVPQIFVYNVSRDPRIGGYEDLIDYLESHGIIGSNE